MLLPGVQGIGSLSAARLPQIDAHVGLGSFAPFASARHDRSTLEADKDFRGSG